MNHPPFCPNPDCSRHTFHLLPRAQQRRQQDWFRYKGTRTTACAGTYQRFQCKTCGHWFCERSFHIDYRVHKPVSYRLLMSNLSSRVSLEAGNRSHRITPAIRVNRIARLARNAIALHAACRPYLNTPEDIIADGFVSFEVSQYYPSNLHIAIGADSEYVFSMEHVTIRRTGTMTASQKRKQARLEAVYRADPGGLTASFRRLMDTVGTLIDNWYPLHEPLQSPAAQITLITDNKREYPCGIGRTISLHQHIARGALNWIHISSKHQRTPGGPMFAMDNFDRELRKDMSAYVRESVTFRRSVQNAMESAEVYRLYHNFFKAYRSRDKTDQKRWQRAGLPDDLVKGQLKHIFTRRAFLSHTEGLTHEEDWVWRRRLYTPGQLKQYLPCTYVIA